MTNYALRIDLLKLRGAFVRNLQGATSTKRCIIIPVDDDPALFLGEKGCYLSATAIELKEPKYSDTHCIKADIPKEERERLSEAELRALPILGGLHAIVRQPQTMSITETLDASAFAPSPEGVASDLPF